jgi:cell division inhibitor SulA
MTPAALDQAVWRANQWGAVGGAHGVPSHFSALDAELPDRGWPQRVLVELLLPSFGIGELRLLLPVLAQATRERKPVMLIAPPAMPYAPALAAGGVALEHLLLVQPRTERDTLWTIEQALKSGSLSIVLAWLPEKHRGLPNDRLRRLQLAATASGGLCFVFRPDTVRVQASPAPLRIALATTADVRLTATIVKRRGPPATQSIVIDLPAPTDGTAASRLKRSLASLLASALPPTHDAALPQAVNDAA